MIGKFIDFKIFIISLAFGLFIVYINNPSPNIIFVYPTPDNVDKILYKDKADACFKFDIMEIPCPTDKNLINTIPMQNYK